MPLLDGNKLELQLQKWNKVVSDETQCMRLSQEEEIKLLSARNVNLGEYLKLHPEMAHELIVPAGFNQRLVRRYERYLAGDTPLSVQNGAADQARWKDETFDALLPGKPKVLSGSVKGEAPTWREINAFVCMNGVDTISGEKMAPHYEYVSSGERVRVLQYKGMQVELSAKQWHMMWEHVVCKYLGPSSPKDVEFTALHEAWNEICTIPAPFSEWMFPGGQQIAIILKQLEYRLRAAHVGRPNPCAVCCPFQSGFAGNAGRKSVGSTAYLSKAVAAELVIEDRLTQNATLKCVNPDPAIVAAVEKKGIDVATLHDKDNACMCCT